MARSYSSTTSPSPTPARLPSEETQAGLRAAGFEIVRVENTLEQARAFGARSRAMVERGEKPPHRAVTLIHGDIAKQAIANTARGLNEGRIVPLEVLARRRPELKVRA